MIAGSGSILLFWFHFHTICLQRSSLIWNPISINQTYIIIVTLYIVLRCKLLKAVNFAWLAYFSVPWKRGSLPTQVFWPGEFHELYSPWGCKELDMTEWISLSLSSPTKVSDLCSQWMLNEWMYSSFQPIRGILLDVKASWIQHCQGLVKWMKLGCPMWLLS